MDGLGERGFLSRGRGQIETAPRQEATADTLQDRSDLLYLALDQRMLMRDIEMQLKQLKGRMAAKPVSPAEIDGVLATHR